MRCPNCQSEIASNSNYCSHCGVKLITCSKNHLNKAESKYCYICGEELHSEDAPEVREGDYNIPVFDKVQEEKILEREEMPTESNSINYKKIVITLLVLALISVSSYAFYKVTPQIKIASKNNLTYNQNTFIAKKTSDIENVSNINNNAAIYDNGMYLYIINSSGQLVKLTQKFEYVMALSGYKLDSITGYNRQLYFTDKENHYLYTVTPGKSPQLLLKRKVYYVNPKGDSIYYQDDEDGESLYVYHLNTHKSEKLVNKHIYGINVIGDVIYYTTNTSIESYNIKTKKITTYVKEKVYNMTYNNQYLYYYSSNAQIKRYSLKTKKIEYLVETSLGSYALSDNYLYFVSKDRKIYQLNLSNKTNKAVYQYQNLTLESANRMQVVGGHLIVNDNGWMMVNTQNTKYAQIFK